VLLVAVKHFVFKKIFLVRIFLLCGNMASYLPADDDVVPKRPKIE